MRCQVSNQPVPEYLVRTMITTFPREDPGDRTEILTVGTRIQDFQGAGWGPRENIGYRSTETPG